ncbi:MAG: hypothetical protein Hyperionvirus9_70 [Hyperionvirus sp.]|uniref:Uncharacterized protein n=1 Tax=Hyperionvirus sp. TaxID=2487770 RepID=A0A3G5ACN9_9VIRU|nr:MAG: hypothetical protein Hyperionvirus9_70 [Hyperionvirus sp.]
MSDIELFFCDSDYFAMVPGQLYKLHDSTCDESFEIIIVFCLQTVDHLNFNIQSTGDGKWTMNGCPTYKNNIGDMWEHTREHMAAFYTTFTLMCRSLEDVKKLKLNVTYIDVPSMSTELKKECDITKVKAPYQKIDLICDHSISYLALIGQMLHKQKDKLTCPVCREDMKIKLINSIEPRTKNILVDDVSGECSQYIWALIGDKNKKCVCRDGMISFAGDKKVVSGVMESIDDIILDSSSDRHACQDDIVHDSPQEIDDESSSFISESSEEDSVFNATLTASRNDR